ncbi:chemotaxis protein CheB [Candidatus Poribacteria bacterium]|nr:chemotaxis protein CheB [Candidatus Poribacteria bacterium]
MKSLPFVGVVMAASTGGPGALTKVFNMLAPTSRATFFVVQHGPAWMLAQRLKRKTTMKVNLAKDGVRAVPGEIYVAPGSRHLLIESGSLTLRLADNPPDGFIFPSANLLFRSAAKAFGRHCLAVVMTGMGYDGSRGAAIVAASGGVVIAQDPETAGARSMPQTVIKMGIPTSVVALEHIAETITRYVDRLFAEIDLL